MLLAGCPLLRKLPSPSKAALSFEKVCSRLLQSGQAKPHLRIDLLYCRFAQCHTRTASAAAAFEAACLQILDVPAETVAVDSLVKWKEEIQVVAEAQLQDSRRTKGSPAVQYFLLRRELMTADTLSPFLNSPAFEDSDLCSETLRNLSGASQELIKSREAKLKKISELEKVLFLELQGQAVEEEALHLLEAQARVTLIEETVMALQEEMEGLLHALEKLRFRIHNEADSATMRSGLRKKQSVVKKQLETVVSRYNAILPKDETGIDRQAGTADDLLLGKELPWQFDRCFDDELEISPGVHKTLHFRQKYELADLYNKWQRLKEESILLVQEQRSYLSFYVAYQEDLRRSIEAWEECLTGPLAVRRTEFHTTSRYSLLDSDIGTEVALIRGTIARLWKTHYDVVQEYEKGRSHFQKEVGGRELPWPKRVNVHLGYTLADLSPELDPYAEQAEIDD
jgi:hypothetical protein